MVNGGGDLFSRGIPSKSVSMSFEGIDGDADFAHFAKGERMIRVHADLRGKIKGNREAAWPFAQEIAVALVGLMAEPKPAYWRIGQNQARR